MGFIGFRQRLSVRQISHFQELKVSSHVKEYSLILLYITAPVFLLQLIGISK